MFAFHSYCLTTFKANFLPTSGGRNGPAYLALDHGTWQDSMKEGVMYVTKVETL